MIHTKSSAPDRHISRTRFNEDEELFVLSSHLLAYEETLTPRHTVIERDGSPKAFHVLVIRGTGMLTLSVATNPLVLTVEN